MATGELTGAPAPAPPVAGLPAGSVVMPAGRISVACEVHAEADPSPFSPVQLARLDEAMTIGSRSTRLHFSVYLGDLGSSPRASAEALHAATTHPAGSVLIAVSPGQRVVEVVTGEASARRLPDRACRLAVMSMVALFEEGDLVGGLVSGVSMLVEQAGTVVRR